MRRGIFEMADQPDNRGVLPKAVLPIAKPAEWWRPGNVRRQVEEIAQVPIPQPQKTESQTEPSGNQVDVRTMIVGSGTSFSGEITDCNRFIVDGTVQAKLGNCQEVIVNESGSFA